MTSLVLTLVTAFISVAAVVGTLWRAAAQELTAVLRVSPETSGALRAVQAPAGASRASGWLGSTERAQLVQAGRNAEVLMRDAQYRTLQPLSVPAPSPGRDAVRVLDSAGRVVQSYEIGTDDRGYWHSYTAGVWGHADGCN
jgi:hypothetical protein